MSISNEKQGFDDVRNKIQVRKYFKTTFTNVFKQPLIRREFMECSIRWGKG